MRSLSNSSAAVKEEKVCQGTFADFVMACVADVSLGKEFIMLMKEKSEIEIFQWFKSRNFDIGIEEINRMIENKEEFGDLNTRISALSY